MAGRQRQQLGPTKKRLLSWIEDSKKLLSENCEKMEHYERNQLKKSVNSTVLKLERTVTTFIELTNKIIEISESNDDEKSKLMNDNEIEDWTTIQQDAEDHIIDLKQRITEIDEYSEYLDQNRSRKIKEEIEVTQLEKQRAEVEHIKKRTEEREPLSRVQNHTHHEVHAKLPLIELPRFDGNILNWNEFWDAFEAEIDTHPTLPLVTKFNYLKGQVFGEALNLIKDLKASNANYTVATKLLKDRYGNVQTIINQHYQKVMDLRKASNTLDSLRQTMNVLEGHLRALEALGEDIGHNHFVSLVMAKLPKEIIIKLEESKDEEEPWNTGDLRKRLQKIVQAKEVTKTWICLFTCLSIRAIHLEVVNDMTSEEFVMALRRFIARRGVPTTVLSDNAKQFIVAKSVLDETWQSMKNDDHLLSYLSSQRIEWKFIIEFAPWMGGVYERLVKMVKECLRKCVGRNMLTYQQLNTFMSEAEAIINSRPLVYAGEDIESGYCICPSDFLGNKVNGMLLHVSNDKNYIETTAHSIIESWKKGNVILDEFWRLWSDEYVLSLRERYTSNINSKRNRNEKKPRLGDIVLIKSSLPRGMWKIGKIVQLTNNDNSNNMIRGAMVKLPNSHVIRRSLIHLYPIEQSKEAMNEDSNSNNIQCKIIRTAAEVAKQKIKLLSAAGV